MKGKNLIWVLCLALAGCNGKMPLQAPDDPTGTPVLFNSGSLTQVRTKADAPLGSTTPYYLGIDNTSGVPYMPLDGRFVCTMYYHSAAGDTEASPYDIKDAEDGGTSSTTWLRVNNNSGNSVYWNMAYNSVAEENIDELGFDRSATCFYWQNRLPHAFLALADYNKLKTNVGAVTKNPEDQGKLKMYPNWDKDFITLPENPTEEQQAAYDDKLSDNRYANTYDLTRGSRTSMDQQPDPILALTIMKPAGATQEANRVRLYFRHQFSQIQVNIKGSTDESAADISADQIDKVELLGISTEGYVCNRLNADGTVGATTAKEVKLDEYSDAQLEENKWGTSFEMFIMDEAAVGYLKSFNAIAFGQLWAIRITWHEGTTLQPGITHVTTYQVPQTNESNEQLRQLQSSMKYIYDLELRRGTLAVIRTEILDWDQKEELVYGTDGTITN